MLTALTPSTINITPPRPRALSEMVLGRIAPASGKLFCSLAGAAESPVVGSPGLMVVGVAAGTGVEVDVGVGVKVGSGGKVAVGSGVGVGVGGSG